MSRREDARCGDDAAVCLIALEGVNLSSSIILSRCRCITECAVDGETEAMEPLRFDLVFFNLPLPICQQKLGTCSIQSTPRAVTMG